jgi:hypothetical protein
LPYHRPLSTGSIVEQRIYRAIERDSCDSHDLLAGNPGRVRNPVAFP